MRTGESLESRQREILAAIVRTHIATGAPVASSLVARKAARPVSSATVRNVMAALEEAGYLHQPHTSAGRVPTPRAFEFYAREVASRARLKPADRRWIKRELGTGEPERLLARVPRVLSELCHGVGLVMTPSLATTELFQVRFVPVEGGRVLAVMVTRDGRVCDKVIRPRELFRPEELDRMSAYMNEHFRGWSLRSIRRELERRVAADRSRFLRQAVALCRESFGGLGEEAPENLQMEGMAHLVERLEHVDPEALRQLLHALEEKKRMARLLADCLETPDSPVRVQVGLERLTPAMKDFVLIGARYGRETAGSLGLLGPTRIDYDRAVTAVAYVAALFGRLPAEN